MKTHDYYFNGIPTMWQIIVIYMYIASPHMPWINFFVTLIFCVLQDVNFNFVHPFRVKRLQKLTITVSLIWTATSLYMIFSEPVHANEVFPYMNVNVGHVILADYNITSALLQALEPLRTLIILLWWLCPAYIIGISTYRTYEKLVGKVSA